MKKKIKSFGTVTTDGGIGAVHPSRALPLYVAPSVRDDFETRNQLRLSVNAIACWRLDNPQFEFDSSFVRPDAATEFGLLADMVRLQPDMPLSVFGHADPTGDDAYNIVLSGRRAKAVYGIITRNPRLWEDLWKPAWQGDDWEHNGAAEAMLAFLGFGHDAVEKMRFRTAHGLPAGDGFLHEEGRLFLYEDYMKALFPLKLKPEAFLAGGKGANRKGDFQGCGEFNPTLLLSSEENHALSTEARNKKNGVNRRVVVFFYEPGTVVEPELWPCPAANTDGGGEAANVAACRRRFWSDGEARRQSGEEEREYKKTQDTMACRFYDKFARNSPCEGRNGPPSFLWLMNKMTTPPSPLSGGVRALDPSGSNSLIFEGRFDAEGKLSLDRIPAGPNHLELFVEASDTVIIDVHPGRPVKNSLQEQPQRSRATKTGTAAGRSESKFAFAATGDGTTNGTEHRFEIARPKGNATCEAQLGPFVWLKDNDGRPLAGTWLTYGAIGQKQSVDKGDLDPTDCNVPLEILKAPTQVQRLDVIPSDKTLLAKGRYLVRSSKADAAGTPNEEALLIAGEFGPSQPNVLRHIPTEETTISVYPAGAIPFGKGFNRVKHFFVLMLENRSYDHMLGGNRNLREADGLRNPDGSLVDRFNEQWIPGLGNQLERAGFVPRSADMGASDPIAVDPGHEFWHARFHLVGWDGNTNPNDFTNVTMGGFVNTYLNRLLGRTKEQGQWDSEAETCHKSVVDALHRVRKTTKAYAESVMLAFPPERLPVLNELAQEYAVCDRWFSSLPGPTWPNRLFLHCGTSGGLEDSPTDPIQKQTLTGYDLPTVFHLLNAAGLPARIYSEGAFPQVRSIKGVPFDGKADPNFSRLERDLKSHYAHMTKGSYTFLEPDYGDILTSDITAAFGGGSSQHPTSNVRGGESLIKRVYDMLRASPIWGEAALIVTYDEHGGFYDHVHPPVAVAPGRTDRYRVHTDANDKNPLFSALARSPFLFKNYGVRVPTVIISPLIPKGVADHTVYDHTSVAATIRRRFGLPTLSDREAKANDFSHLFALEIPRSDTPSLGSLEVDRPIDGVSESEIRRDNLESLNAPLSGNARGFLAIIVKSLLEQAPDKLPELTKMLAEVTTVGTARAFLEVIRLGFEFDPST